MYLFDLDQRPAAAPEPESGLTVVPRDYQQRGIEKTLELFDSGAPGVLFRQFTGSGKTVTGSLIIHRWISRGEDYHAIVLCHERQLVQQFADEVFAITGIEPGIEMADQRVYRESMPKIVIASRATLQERVVSDGEEEERISRLYKFDNQLNWLVVADECHRWSYRLKSCRHIIDWFSANERSRRLGLTATPLRGDKVSLAKLFPEVGADYRQFDINGGPCGVRDGWAVPYDQRFVEVAGVDFKNLREVSGDFDENELEAIMGERQQMLALVKPMLDIAGDRKTLIFNPTVAVAKLAAHTINEFSLCRCECGAPQWVERERIALEGMPECAKCGGTLTVEREGDHAEPLDGSYPDSVRRECYQRYARRDFSFLSVCGLCIAEGSLVLTDRGEVPIEDVTTDMLLWDGVEYVPHDGVVWKGRKRVIEYAGLKATEDHNVWTDAGWKTLAECKRDWTPVFVGNLDGTPILESRSVQRMLRRIRNSGETVPPHEAEVYDILNAGPRNRFTANGLIVSNCREGFNDRGIGAVAIFRPTKSRSLAEQMKGRGCRPLAGVVDGLDTPDERRAAIAASEKPSCIIIDLVGISGLADCASTAHLLAEGKPDEVIELANANAVKKSAAGESVDMAQEILDAEAEIEEREARKRREAEERERARLERIERQKREREEAARKSRLLVDVEYNERRVNPGERVDAERRKSGARMPYGKHKGKLVAELNTPYIETLLAKAPPRTAWLLHALENELLARRGRPAARSRPAASSSQPPSGQPSVDEINLMLLER